MRKRVQSFAALVAVAGSFLLAGVLRADFLSNIYYPQPNGTAWESNLLTNGLSLNAPTAIESFDNANEFVVTSAEGVRNYYFSGNDLSFVQISNVTEYTGIADMGNAQASYVAVGANGRIDRLFASGNDWATTTILAGGTLTGNVKVESYDFFGVFVTMSNEGVRFYDTSGNLGGQISNRTDYVSIADNALGTNNETFFAIASDGSVDKIKYTGAGPFGYTTELILPAGTLTGVKDIESYDGNNEFVTVSEDGIREYYFSGGTWQFDLMSSFGGYFGIADNGGAPADYFALGVGVPEPSCLAATAMSGLMLLRRRASRRRSL